MKINLDDDTITMPLWQLTLGFILLASVVYIMFSYSDNRTTPKETVAVIVKGRPLLTTSYTAADFTNILYCIKREPNNPLDTAMIQLVHREAIKDGVTYIAYSYLPSSKSMWTGTFEASDVYSKVDCVQNMHLVSEVD